MKKSVWMTIIFSGIAIGSIAFFQNMTSTITPCMFNDPIFGSIEINRVFGQTCESVCNRERNLRQERSYSRENETKNIKDALANFNGRYLPISCSFKGGGKVPLSRNYIAVINGVNRGVNIPLSDSLTLEDADIQFLNNYKFKSLRQRINPSRLFNDEFTELRLNELDNLIRRLDLLTSNGFTVIVDFHRNNFQHDLRTIEGQEKLVIAWEMLADALKKYDRNVYFELLNEPALQGKWWPLQKIIVSKIREISPERIIVVSGDNYSDYSQLTGRTKSEQFIKIDAKTAESLSRGQQNKIYSAGVNDPNVIYNFHFYNPMIFTHQGTDFGGRVSFNSRLKKVPWPINEDHAICLRLLSGDTSINQSHRFKLTAPFKEEGTNNLIRTCSTSEFSHNPIIFRSHIVNYFDKLPTVCIEKIAQVIPNSNKEVQQVSCTYKNSLNKLKTITFSVNVYNEGPKTNIKSLDKKYLESAIGEVSRWANDNRVKIMVNEFGVFKAADVESKKRYYRDVTSLFEKYGIDWYIWEYRYDKGFGFAKLNLETNQVEEKEEGIFNALGLEP
ncbi:MAG: glycoside hydrolase family 5 protein [Bacteriovoracaceae bacterium]